jgi:hypothetical protein
MNPGLNLGEKNWGHEKYAWNYKDLMNGVVQQNADKSLIIEKLILLNAYFFKEKNIVTIETPKHFFFKKKRTVYIFDHDLLKIIEWSIWLSA